MARPAVPERPNVPAITGIGLRQPHYAAFMALRPALPFVEVHSENFFGDGGAALQVLHDVREVVDVSLHGVGLALGSAAGLDPWHLDRLARLVERIDPLRVSDHASFARGLGHHANDLLPIAFTPASLDLLVANVQRVQDRLKRPLGVENLSAYLRFDDAPDAMPEPRFFAELARRSGCWLLLDVNNLVVNALNAGQDPVAVPCAWIDALGPDAPVGEIHLAGYVETPDLVIDDHGSRVKPPVWAVYAHAVARFGPRPTLVEWDTDLPALDVLLHEAAEADRLCVR
ncbi:MAG: DUF692 domain-containing protein [Burkholderiaceae bacterium]|nr:DUF692 domain-containing protein [Burkholderiaceae bacterium]